MNMKYEKRRFIKNKRIKNIFIKAEINSLYNISSIENINYDLIEDMKFIQADYMAGTISY